MPWITVAKSVFKSPKVLGSIGLVIVIGIGALYLNHRKDTYEDTISTLTDDLEDKKQYIKDQQAEFDKYRISVSTSLTEQALKLSESRREAQERVQALEGQIDDIRSKTPETYSQSISDTTSDNDCKASEALIDDMLGLE